MIKLQENWVEAFHKFDAITEYYFQYLVCSIHIHIYMYVYHIYIYIYIYGDRGSTVVKVLCYNSIFGMHYKYK